LFTFHVTPNSVLNQCEKAFEGKGNSFCPYFPVPAGHVGIKAEWAEAMRVKDNCDIPAISALPTIDVPGRQWHCVDKKLVSIGICIAGKLVENGEVADIPSLGANEELLHEQRSGIRVRRPRLNRIE
jgi:hypothetical protein